MISTISGSASKSYGRSYFSLNFFCALTVSREKMCIRDRMEGVPTVLLGISVLFILKDSPDKVSWLSPEEKRWLKGELAQDQARYGATEQHRLLDAFRMPAVWLLAGVYIIIQIGVYIVNLWMPLILSSLSQKGAAVASASLIARYATLPYLLAAIRCV